MTIAPPLQYCSLSSCKEGFEPHQSFTTVSLSVQGAKNGLTIATKPLGNAGRVTALVKLLKIMGPKSNQPQIGVGGKGRSGGSEERRLRCMRVVSFIYPVHAARRAMAAALVLLYKYTHFLSQRGSLMGGPRPEKGAPLSPPPNTAEEKERFQAGNQ